MTPADGRGTHRRTLAHAMQVRVVVVVVVVVVVIVVRVVVVKEAQR